ncbi:MAG: 50S ribosomal protein L10 [Dehalococcoidia bacterium]|nr:50S ribosomal protein L10 [Dehalococcoidia bacterium]
MPTQAKEDAVELLKDKFERSSIVITTNYSGLPVSEMTELRRALREANVEYRIIKNTLAYIAADQAGKPAIKDVINGPTGVAFGYEDPLEPARALSGFIRTNRSSLAIMGGEMDGRPLTSDQVNQLATMPGREELVAQLLMRMNSPVAGLVNVLNGPIAALARVLQGHVDNIQQQEA